MEARSVQTVVLRPARDSDRADVERLLAAAKLPLAGVGEPFAHYVVAVTSGGVVGAIGVESHTPYGLLRSAVVDGAQRGRGIGALLTAKAIERSRAAKLRALYLLTTDASEYFRRHGFREVAREALPRELGASEELKGACPDTAVAMVLEL